jgi:hypothetical protein
MPTPKPTNDFDGLGPVKQELEKVGVWPQPFKGVPWFRLSRKFKPKNHKKKVAKVYIPRSEMQTNGSGLNYDEEENEIHHYEHISEVPSDIKK